MLTSGPHPATNLRPEFHVCVHHYPPDSVCWDPTAKIAEAALDSLVSAGLGLWRETPAGTQGGRPARVAANAEGKNGGELLETLIWGQF